MGFGGGDLGEDLGGKLWRGQQGAAAATVSTLSPPAAPFVCRGFDHVCAVTWGGARKPFDFQLRDGIDSFFTATEQHGFCTFSGKNTP
jgi:hypothetical protein